MQGVDLRGIAPFKIAHCRSPTGPTPTRCGIGPSRRNTKIAFLSFVQLASKVTCGKISSIRCAIHNCKTKQLQVYLELKLTKN